MIIIDNYPLVQSNPFDLKPSEEARIDLVLKKRPTIPVTQLNGIVTTDDFKPIYNATVKVLDNDYNPVAHSITDINGKYIMKDVLKPGRYKLTATAEGFLTAKTINFVIKNKTPKVVDIKLKKNPSVNKGTIYGLVIDSKNMQIIAEASIILLDENKKPVAETQSNSHGQYILSRITPDRYSIIASKIGYLCSSTLIVVEKDQIIKSDIQLIENSEPLFGTISGLIKGECELLEDVCVGLYKIDDGIETLIQIGTTNSEGLYLFANVKSGKYMVKAKSESFGKYCQEFLLLNNNVSINS